MTLRINDIAPDFEAGHTFDVPAVSDDEARQKYPAGWNTVLPYLRLVAQP